MTHFLEGISPEDADSVDRLTKLTYELRENRKRLLQAYGAIDETRIEEGIRNGSLEEHPAYEHYLSAKILEMARESIRNDLKTYLKEL